MMNHNNQTKDQKDNRNRMKSELEIDANSESQILI